MHTYSEGGDGFGMRPTGKAVVNWSQVAVTWFHTICALK